MSNRKILIISALICFVAALVLLVIFFIGHVKLFLSLGILWLLIGGIVLGAVKLEEMSRRGGKR